MFHHINAHGFGGIWVFSSFLFVVPLIALSRMKTPPTIIILRLMCALSFLSLELNFSTHSFTWRSLTRSLFHSCHMHLFQCVFSHSTRLFICSFSSLNSYHIFFLLGFATFTNFLSFILWLFIFIVCGRRWWWWWCCRWPKVWFIQ